MRILDEQSDKSIDRVTLFLTSSEARELLDSLRLILEGNRSHHEHVSSDDFKKELTVTIYDANDLDTYDVRSQRLIVKDI